MITKTNATVILAAAGLAAEVGSARAQSFEAGFSSDATLAAIGSGESDLGSDDTIQFSRAVVGASTTWTSTPQLSFGAEVLLGRTSYEFDTLFLGDQTVDVDEFSIGLPISFDVGGGARAFFTPSLTFQGEDGVSFGDGASFSLLGGVGWQVSPNLFIGPGLGIAETLVTDDDPSIFPFLIIDWQFTEEWSISTGPGFAASRGPGLRLSYEPNNNWEFGVEARLEEFEFQLDDRSPITNGVGRDSSIPVIFLAQYKPNDRVTLSGFAGAATGGSLELFDQAGTKVFDEDYDTAPLFGLAASIAF